MIRVFGRVSLFVLIVLAACTADPTSSPGSSFSSGPSPTEPGTPMATASASPSAEPTDPSGSSDFTWTEAGRFADEGKLQLVTDVTAWSGGFMAIGHRWTGEFLVGEAEPRIWTSVDGQDWTAARPRLGTGGVELRGLLRLSAGGLILIGRVPVVEGASWTARAWRSQDGERWTAMQMPAEMAGTNIDVASGPVGHVISTGRELWYSAEGISWQRVHRTPVRIALGLPAAGDEGFVAPTSGGDGAPVYASGDGLTWFEGAPPESPVGVTAWRGDWLGWAYTDEASTISILRSSDGLNWAIELDVNDLTPPDGPKAGQGLESEITEVTLAGEGGVVAMTLGWNHCCVQPPQGVAVYVSTDAETWTTAELPENTYVTSLATDGEVVVMAGQLRRGNEVAFWVADR